MRTPATPNPFHRVARVNGKVLPIALTDDLNLHRRGASCAAKNNNQQCERHSQRAYFGERGGDKNGGQFLKGVHKAWCFPLQRKGRACAAKNRNYLPALVGSRPSGTTQFPELLGLANKPVQLLDQRAPFIDEPFRISDDVREKDVTSFELGFGIAHRRSSMRL